MNGMHIGLVDVHHDQVCSVSFSEESAVCSALAFCSVYGGCPENLLRGYRRRVAELHFGRQCHDLHFFKEIQTVVAGHAVGSYGYINAHIKELWHVAHAACQLHVADWVCSYSHALFFEYVEVLALNPYTMGRCRRHIPCSQTVKVLHRCHAAVAFLTFLVLRSGFGNVNVHVGSMLPAESGHGLHCQMVGGVLAVNAHIHFYSFIFRIMICFESPFHFLH